MHRPRRRQSSSSELNQARGYSSLIPTGNRSMKRSKQITALILLASVAPLLAACDGDDPNDGMKFESYEECSINIGPENCQKAPEQVKVQQGSSGGSSSTFMPIFLPMPGYHGGYLDSAPRAQSSYTPKSSIFKSSTSRMPSAFRGSSSSSTSRGGFGSSSRSFSGGGS